MFEGLSQYRKAVTAVVGAALILLAAFAPGKYDAQVAQVLAFLTAIGVWAVPNETPQDPSVPPGD